MSEVECYVCLEPVLFGKWMGRCGHEIHERCLNIMMQTGNRKCGLCRGLLIYVRDEIIRKEKGQLDLIRDRVRSTRQIEKLMKKYNQLYMEFSNSDDPNKETFLMNCHLSIIELNQRLNEKMCCF